MATIYERLKKAAEAHEPVTIVYRGGTQPGTKRRIVPLIFDDGLVLAEDLASNKQKHYALSKIEIVSEDVFAPEYDPNKRTPQTLADVFEFHGEELKQLGWRVVLTAKSIELYAGRSDTPTAGIQPNYDSAITIGLGGSSFEKRESLDYPWFVFGPHFAEWIVELEPDELPGQAYKYFSRAIKIFLEQARRYAPKAKGE